MGICYDNEGKILISTSALLPSLDCCTRAMYLSLACH